MTLQQMKSICAVVKCGSFSLASRKVHMSQSAVSKHVSALEQDMGFAILDRSSPTLALTPEGSQVMVEIWELTRTYNRLQQVIGDIHLSKRTKEIQSIALCGLPVMEELQMLPRFDQFMVAYPDQRLALQIKDEAQLLVDLDARGLELVFCSDLVLDTSLYTCYPYCKQSFAVFVSVSHPLAKQDSVTMGDLASYPLVMPARESMLLSLCIAACDANGFRPEISLTTNRPVLALGYIKHNDHVYLGLDLDCPTIDPTTHKKLHLENAPSFHYIFAHHKEVTLSAASQQFLRWMMGEEI